MPDQLEVGLDFVNRLLAQGETLLKVDLHDNNQLTEFPLTIFDGESFLAPMQKLEHEWQELLKPAVLPASTADQALIDLTRKRLDLCGSALASQIRMLAFFEALVQRTNEQTDYTSRRSILIDSYERQIRVYTRQVAQSKLLQKAILTRLKTLS